MSPRILCINCGLCLNRLKRHNVLNQDTNVISLIAVWISPRSITEDDNICQACFDAVILKVNQSVHRDISRKPARRHARVVGHSNVCLKCGCSILRKKSDLILRSNPSELQKIITNVIMNSIEKQEVNTTDRICHSCYMKAKRSALRIKAEPISVVLPTSKEEPQEEFDIGPPEEPLEATIEEPETPDIQRSDEIMNEEDMVVPSRGVTLASSESECEVTNVTLESYKRAPNSASQCVFPSCVNQELHRISDDMRIKIIIDHHFYLPTHARVCGDHLLSNSWDTLFHSPNSTAQFTVEQIEHMFSFINFNRNKNIDFNDPLNIDDHLFEYWLGLTKDKFRDLLNDVPQIETIHRGVTGLVAYLIKLRNGDSDDRIASLMGIPRRTLERLMNNVREKLLQLNILYYTSDNS